MQPSTSSRGSGPGAFLLIAAVAIVAAMAASNLPLQTVAAPQGAAPSASHPLSHPSGVTGTSSAGTSAKAPAAPSALAGSRCWAYTEAGDSTTSIHTAAQALASSPCSVDSWVLQWRYLEPSAGTYNWPLVDAAINDSVANGKTVVLRVLAGITSPAWLSGAARMVTVPSVGLSRPGVMPVPWNRGFLNAWDTFIKAFGARYDGNPHIALIETAGTGIYGESYLPGGLTVWNPVGYTEARYLASTEAVVSQFVAAFPHTYVALDASTGVSGSDQNVMMPLVQWVAQHFPTRVYAQQNGLSASSPLGHQAVVDAPLFGLQMLGPSSQSRTGSLCTAFATALEDHADYVEVYSSDATNPAAYSALTYLNNGVASASC
jgi:hypothetical protein